MIKLGLFPGTIEIHTSDRQTFKRCRRRYEWGSTTRRNLIRIGPDNSNFFLGTGFHFSLEDYWGYRRFAHPALAFAAYYDAQKKDDLPDDAEELLDLAVGMLTYYTEDWLAQWPEPFETLWVDGKPQVEVEVAVDITDDLFNYGLYNGIPDMQWLVDVMEERNVDRIVYVTTYDRVVIDRHERIAPVDYKTAAQFDIFNLQTNPQAGSYDWSADRFYTPLGFKVEGMIWQQHKKSIPKAPPIVNKGKKNEGLSLNASQQTTYRIYLKEARRYYGDHIPEDQLAFIANLGNTQDDDGDNFVRRQLLRRNSEQRRNVQEQMLDEVLEMLDPGLPLYPNFTKDCGWDCPFKIPCLNKEDGSDFEQTLATEYTQWQGYKDDWRRRIKFPDAAPATA